MTALHGCDLAGALAGKQEQLQARVERRPQQRYLGVGKNARAVRGRVLVHVRARIEGDDLLADRPGEDRRRRDQHLVGEDRGFDPEHQGADVGAGDGDGLEVAPAR